MVRRIVQCTLIRTSSVRRLLGNVSLMCKAESARQGYRYIFLTNFCKTWNYTSEFWMRFLFDEKNFITIIFYVTIRLWQYIYVVIIVNT